MKSQFTVMTLGLLLAACTNSTPDYKSVDEYPVRKGSLEEMSYSPKQTQFAVWSPAAEQVTLNLYADAETEQATEKIPMKRSKDGTWKACVKRDLNGMFYTFAVYQPNSSYQLTESPGLFAKAVGINGKRAAIIDMDSTNPEGWSEDRRPFFGERKDAIIYEMHHRDFSIDPSAGAQHPGKFIALTEHGTLSPEGERTGIDHLIELGVTHVQLLPSYDFGSIDERGATTEAQVLESGAAVGGTYNWGYDPINYNVPEGSYSTNPYDPACRIREMKQMIQALHNAGIRVVMDVVYNHTYDVDHSNFTQTAPGYFYRTRDDGSLGNASGCGNETASNRPMMRKFIVESVRYWATEYHIDGFRFDLMGIHDIETMREVRATLDDIDPTILLYGEGWAAEQPLYAGELLAMKANVREMPGIGAFCDEMRDALRGPFSDDRQPAFLNALPGHEESIRFGIAGCTAHPQIDMSKVNYSKEPWAAEPYQCISYVSCHDDMMLTDRLKASISLQEGEMERLDKLAQTAVLTSQGSPFIWNGEEIMRNKKGVHNSFCSPDSVNAIDWSLKAKNKDLFSYYCHLIALRKAHPAFRLGTTEAVAEHLEFLEAPDCVVAFRLKELENIDEWKDIVVILNAQREPVEIAIPRDIDYAIVAKDGEFLSSSGDGVMPTVTDSAMVEPQTALILRAL
ncbi:MAG: type I pullulanase [Paludibacteraceae bacterium]|nr:type I pullulanase [Paludibacteraceae bacterium]